MFIPILNYHALPSLINLPQDPAVSNQAESIQAESSPKILRSAWQATSQKTTVLKHLLDVNPGANPQTKKKERSTQMDPSDTSEKQSNTNQTKPKEGKQPKHNQTKPKQTQVASFPKNLGTQMISASTSSRKLLPALRGGASFRRSVRYSS